MISTQNYFISFGNSSNSPFSIIEFKKFIEENKEILRNKITTNLPGKSYFLHQTHSIEGTILDNEFSKSFDKDGDFIITNLKNVSIGVLTADCLPIIFYDTVNNVAAVAHAGWKGTTNNIGQITFEKMRLSFESDPKTTKVFFGPSAKACCYEVDSNFKNNITQFIDKTLIKKNDKIFFDLPMYNKLSLEQLGIENIELLHNTCTICNTNFCSARREKENSRRQMSTIVLK